MGAQMWVDDLEPDLSGQVRAKSGAQRDVPRRTFIWQFPNIKLHNQYPSKGMRISYALLNRPGRAMLQLSQVAMIARKSVRLSRDL